MRKGIEFDIDVGMYEGPFCSIVINGCITHFEGHDVL